MGSCFSSPSPTDSTAALRPSSSHHRPSLSRPRPSFTSPPSAPSYTRAQTSDSADFSSDFAKFKSIAPVSNYNHHSASRTLKSDPNGLPDWDSAVTGPATTNHGDSFDHDSGYSSPKTIGAASGFSGVGIGGNGGRILTKRSHKQSVTSVDAPPPDFSNRPFGHSAAVWSSAGEAKGSGPGGLQRQGTIGKGSGQGQQGGGGRLRSIDVVDQGRTAKREVMEKEAVEKPRTGPTAFELRMQKRNAWTQRVMGDDDATSSQGEVDEKEEVGKAN